MTAYPGLLYGEEINTARAHDLMKAFGGGISAPARRVMERRDGVSDDDPDAGVARGADSAIRFPGVRDILVAGDPVVADLSARLAADPGVIPAPDEGVVAHLSALDGYARDGKVITIHGVPVPAGRPQTDYYIVLRWRPLYSPFALPHLIYSRDPADVRPADRAALGVAEDEEVQRIHLVDHDARHVTDETQASLLMFSTAIHRDNLVELQTTNPALFVALWRRDMDEAWRLGRKMRNGDLPVSNPRSRVRSRLRRLIYGAALMSEWERLFEIIEALRAEKGVTRDSVRAALLGCSSLTGVALIETEAFVATAVAHVRALHPTMDPDTADRPDRVAAAFGGSAIFRTRYRAVRAVAGGIPVRYFLGVEPGMLALVALVHMVENVKRLEGDHRQPGRAGLGTFDRQDTASVELAVLVTSNLCLPTARTILQREAKLGGSDKGWARVVIPTLIDNPHLRDEAERLYAKQHGLTGALPQPAYADCDRKRRHSPYEKAGMRAKLCAAPVGQQGWTQGFRFEAWLRPDAELAFLRNCCRYIQYDQGLAEKRDAHLAEHFPDSADAEADAMASNVPLPRQHPLERIQDLFRRFFDRLQVAEQAAERASAESRANREAILREVAPLLAAVSPITVDPYLNERMLAPPTDAQRRVAREVFWNI
ncbi:MULTISPECIES: hypothetical protein [Sphingomonas]|uniref:hypothetical protein n=1 Tax=Sphingomonas TaxID=13687 RepID=UPI0012EED30E|nr:MULTISPECIES: hypothetical protein [Sphingomonas]WCP73387.1 hypothetical protein PPZ50_07545 [Sphingomonas hankookensis]